MNIKKIKMQLEQNKGKELRFRFNGSRNQIEEFSGIIENTYNYIFVIRTKDKNNQLKSFTYSDVLTDSLEIFVK
ncbi:MAG: Veg family protein [Clostridia bacterium]